MRVAIIPARGGSRRIPRKNIRMFHGKPIIAYSIEAAKASGLFERIIVSTDDREIAGIAEVYGARIALRHPSLAEDHVGTQEVARACLQFLVEPRFDHACCIYATAPMLTAEDLRIGFDVLKLLPSLAYAYVPGQFYWGRVEAFTDGTALSVGHEIRFPPERYIDINTEDDFRRAEEMYAALHPEVA